MTRLGVALPCWLAVLCLALGACSLGDDPGDEPSTDAAPEASSGFDPADPAIGDLPTTSGIYDQPIAVAEGVNPPTSSWIAPAVFAPDDRPVFTGVLSARVSSDSVTVGLPVPATSEGIVAAPHRDDVRLGLSADSYELVRRDGVSATLAYSQADSVVGELTLAAGWPYAQYTATTAQQVTVPDGAGPGEGGLELTAGPTRYHLVGGTPGEGTVDLAAGESLLVTAAPVDAPGPLVAALLAGAVPLEGVETAASVDGQQARTQLTYETDEGAPTVVVAPPHVGLPDGAEVVGTVPSLLGDLRLLAGSVLETSVPVTEPQTRLDLDGLSDEDRATVVERLRQDVDTLDFPSPDSYHGGKEVQRAATLYELALTLGEDALAEEVKGPLVEQLDLWFDPSGCRERQERCFTYDTTLGGMLARQPSYGSDELNDHHFHYGHLLYAAGVLAQADPDLVERWEKVADLVAADIASPQATALFPAHRPFDPWYGHSWASGTAPFADGNNQESSSEAVNGWAGATLWATARGDDELSDTARWMLSNETAATLAYWIDPGLDAAYGAPSVSLNWQGKREFATWFSPEPSAIVGIQLIPMAPTQVGYLGSDPEAVADMVAAAGDLTPGRPLVDQVLMAQSIVDPGSARATLTAFGRDDIDPGTSWSYLTALVLSR